MILNKKQTEKARWYNNHVMDVGDLTDKTWATNALNIIDTIADRDKQIDDLRAKVERYAGAIDHLKIVRDNLEDRVKELESRPYRPQPVIAEEPKHEPDCNALTPQIEGMWVKHSCTCGAVKEPEVKCAYCKDSGCTECPEDSGNKQYL